MGEFMKKVVFVLIIILTLIGVFVYKDDKVDKMLKEEYTSKYKINDLYNSKEIAYRSLSSDEAKIYDKIINEIINFNSKITINLSKYNYNNPYLNFNKLEEIIDAISIDHPELIYFGYPSLNVNGNSNKVNITIHYVMDENTYKNSINLIKDEIDKIKVSTKDMDEYEKIKYVYEYLGFKNNYGKINDPMAQSAYSAFDSKHSPVCAGYAKASELTALAERVTTIEGKVTTLEGKVAALETVGAEKNVINSVDEAEFTVDSTRKLSVKEIAMDKITGLPAALEQKVSVQAGYRMITDAEGEKLEKLVLSEDGTVEVSGTIAAGNVDGLESWITTRAATLKGLSENNLTDALKTKIESSQANVIEIVKVNGVAVEVSAEDKSVNIPMATAAALGVVKGTDAENGIAVADDGTMSVNSVNVNKLVQTEGDSIVLDGGNSAE